MTSPAEADPLRAPGTAVPRGRPRDFDTATVLEAALEVFWRLGYRTATLRELEEATGLSQSSIYNAFGSKWGLLEAALAHYEAVTNARLLVPLRDSADGLASIERFFEDLVEWVTRGTRRGCVLVNLLAEDGGETPAVVGRVGAYRSQLHDAFEVALGRAFSLGELSEDARSVRADLLVGLMLGVLVSARGDVPREQLDELVLAIGAQLKRWRA